MSLAVPLVTPGLFGLPKVTGQHDQNKTRVDALNQAIHKATNFEFNLSGASSSNMA